MYTIERTDYDEQKWYWNPSESKWTSEPVEMQEFERADFHLQLIVARGLGFGDPLELRRGDQLITAY